MEVRLPVRQNIRSNTSRTVMRREKKMHQKYNKKNEEKQSNGVERMEMKAHHESLTCIVIKLNNKKKNVDKT